MTFLLDIVAAKEFFIPIPDDDTQLKFCISYRLGYQDIAYRKVITLSVIGNGPCTAAVGGKKKKFQDRVAVAIANANRTKVPILLLA